MQDKNLGNILRQLKTPEPSEEIQERGWNRVRAAFREEKNLNPLPFQLPIAPLAFSLALAALIVLTPKLKSWFDVQEENSWEHIVRQEAMTLKEFEVLFEGQLAGVITDKKGSRVIISEDSQEAPSQAILLHFTRGEHTLRIVTYSGSRLAFDSESGLPELEVMETGDGDILLLGPETATLSKGKGKFMDFSVKSAIING
jgi:hypothetical protein